jgi:hypothetical protein
VTVLLSLTQSGQPDDCRSGLPGRVMCVANTRTAAFGARLEGWLALMAPDVRYLVPPLDMPDGDHRDTLFLIANDRPPSPRASGNC